MKNRNKTLLVVVLFLLAVLLSCTNPQEPDVAGDGSQTETAKIAGIIYNDNGTPSKNTKVYFITYDHQPNPGLSKSDGIFDIGDSATTDSNGYFSFDSMAADTYNVFGEDSAGNLSYQDSVIVTDDTTQTDTVPPDTLGLPGSLAGYLKMEPGDDPRTVTMYVIGAVKYALPELDASFSLTDMAEGTYRVRILSTLDKYLPLDTTLTIESGTDLNLTDSIPLPLRIPKITGLTLSYDTLKQIVTLSWDRADTTKIKGYNVYRQHVDSTDVKLNVQALTDTFYVDSTGVQDESYVYSVVGVDLNGEEGIKVRGDSVEVVSYFSTVDSISLLAANSLNSIALGSDGSLFGVEEKIIHRIGTNQGGAEDQWSLPDSVGTVYHVAVLDDSTLVVHSTDKLIAFSLSDSLIQKVWYGEGEVRDVAYSPPYIYFIDGSAGSPNWRIRRINYYTDSTEDVVSMQSDFPDLDADLIEGLASQGDTLAFAVRHYTDNRSRTVFSVCRYDIASGAKSIVHEMPWQTNQNPSFTVLDGSILMTTNNTGRLLQDQLFFAWTLPGYTRAVAAADLSTVYVAGGYSKVYVYSR